ncbi:hypothetical protein IFM89_030116 [Coptis chinensis]|uniref:Uncharacterized protein n=1 Tax=Coptis chinensis TaxID=261450 RepID=A0A835I726_9MAGN|nr:hypothetical protein IFM89_030116 [Coptis chinensis]
MVFTVFDKAEFTLKDMWLWSNLKVDANLKLRLGTGILIAVPIPKEHAASGNFIEYAIQKALQEARDNKVIGNAETPFLLARVNELTGGASLASSILFHVTDIALVKNNAFVGAQIAVALSRLRQGGSNCDFIFQIR